jgi:hypothetical protein
MGLLQTFEHKGAVLQISAYEAGPPKPKRAWSLRKPGAGRFEIGQIELSEDRAGFVLTARVSGRNIAYIYTEILLKDKTLDRFYGPVSREHVHADRSKEIRGVSRPDWDNPVDLAVGLDPGLRLLSDGADSAFCFSVPERYDSLDQRLEGLYAPADGAGPFRALLLFDSDGELRRAVARREQGRRSLPHALTPGEGDRFTPFVQVLTPPAEGGEWNAALALDAARVPRSGIAHD